MHNFSDFIAIFSQLFAPPLLNLWKTFKENCKKLLTASNKFDRMVVSKATERPATIISGSRQPTISTQQT